MDVWSDIQADTMGLDFPTGSSSGSWVDDLMSSASPPYDLPSSPSSTQPSSPSEQYSPNSLLDDPGLMMPVTEVDAGTELDAMQLDAMVQDFVDSTPGLCMGEVEPLSLPQVSLVQAKSEGSVVSAARSSSRCKSLKPSFDSKPANKITKNTKSKKKKVVSLATKTDLSFTREEVLNMTCADLDRIVAHIHKTRDLTREEEQEVRKQRRLIKNRESAAASRNRKQGMVRDLEATLHAYKVENEQLRQQVGRLQEENVDLRTKLANLTSPASSLLSVGRPSKQTGQAAVCLFVVLLSFGLVFNQFDASPAVAGPLATALANYQMPQVATMGRVAESETGGLLSLPKGQQQAAPSRRQLLGAKSGYSVFVDEGDRPETAVIEPVLVKSEDPTITVQHSFNPNTTYITVLDGKQEGRPLEQNFPEDGSPFLIELIIPPESPVQPGDMEYESALEITCKVIETRLSTRSTMQARGQLAAGPSTGVVSVM